MHAMSNARKRSHVHELLSDISCARLAGPGVCVGVRDVFR